MPDTTYKARKWGKAHGFYGMPGGWIYREGDKRTTTLYPGGYVVQKPVCQGWAQLYKWYGHEIERYHEQTKRK